MGMRPHRDRWQVPVFLAGVIVAALGIVARPPWRQPSNRHLDTQLTAARSLLDHSPPAIARARALAEGVLASEGATAQEKGRAALMVGSAWALQAGREPGRAAQDWRQARHYLELAESFGIPAEDRPALAYRLAQALDQTNGDPARIIEYLHRAAPPAGEDRPDALLLLSTACLRLPVPDVAAALAANEKLLALPLANPSVLAPARLARAEMLLLDHRRDEARAVLANVTRKAAPDLYRRARRLRAALCQEQAAWQEAQGLWEEILDDPTTPVTERSQTLFDLGICYAEQGRAADACRVWNQAAEGGEGAVAVAAAWKLADVAARAGDAGRAYAACLRGLRGANGPAGLVLAKISLEEARRTCEAAFQLLRGRGIEVDCRQLLDAYGLIAPPGRAAELLASWLESLATRDLERPDIQHEPRASVESAPARRDYLAEAGAAWVQAADAVRGQAAEAARVWRSAECFRRAGDHRRAISAIQRFLAGKPPPEQVAEAWYLLGLAHESAGDPTEAMHAYEQCIQQGRAGAFAYRARCRLAEAMAARGRISDAEQVLRQNLELMGADPDPEAHERSLMGLAGLLYRRGEYRLASVHLQKLLERYPRTARGVGARHVLADCYRRLADAQHEVLPANDAPTVEARAYAKGQYRLWLSLAAANYKKLREDLLAASGKHPLLGPEAAILQDAEAAEVDCRYNLGEYETAAALAEQAAQRHRDRVEALLFYRQVLRSHWAMTIAETDSGKRVGRVLKARRTVEQARTCLAELPDTAFVGAPDVIHDRRWWEQWLDWAAKQW